MLKYGLNNVYSEGIQNFLKIKLIIDIIYFNMAVTHAENAGVGTGLTVASPQANAVFG